MISFRNRVHEASSPDSRMDFWPSYSTLFLMSKWTRQIKTRWCKLNVVDPDTKTQTVREELKTICSNPAINDHKYTLFVQIWNSLLLQLSAYPLPPSSWYPRVVFQRSGWFEFWSHRPLWLWRISRCATSFPLFGSIRSKRKHLSIDHWAWQVEASQENTRRVRRLNKSGRNFRIKHFQNLIPLSILYKHFQIKHSKRENEI